MSSKIAPWNAATIGFLLLGVVTACVVGPGGYDGTVGVAYVGDYYEPYGYDYGSWGGGYRVGPPPPRGGEHGGGERGGGERGGGGHAGGGHGAPSIPSHPRGHH